jgi:thioredoxin-like negative regulator of GroEL
MNEKYLPERKAFLEEVEALLGKSDYLTVLSLAESRLKRTPGDMDARISICRVWIEQERLEEAGEILREMEEILASLAQIYACMGDLYLKKGMPESAHAFYRTYVSLNLDTPMAREINERLKGVSQQQATDDGVVAEKEEAAQVPDGLQTVTLAELYARQGHLQMAEEILAAILNNGPHHPKAAEMLQEVRRRIATQEKPGAKHAQVALGDAGERIATREKPEEWSAPEILREAQAKIVDPGKPGGKPVAE